MVKTCALRIKRMRAETECLKQCKEESWNVVDAIDIRSRVSVRSIRNLKRHSKYFATLQLAESRKNPSFIACHTRKTSMKLYSMDARISEISPLNTIGPFERRDNEFLYMISSFNGLICCVNQICDESKFCDLHIWICNPCTGETLLLPQGRPSFEFEPRVGVAYSSDISDYRVFRIFSTGKKIPEERVSEAEYYFHEGRIFTRYRYTLAYECEVYSSSTGSWKNIGSVPDVPMGFSPRPYESGHVFIGGKIYWLVSLNEPGEILSVDLGGRFEVINLPQYLDDLNGEDKITEATHMFILQGSLALLVLHPSDMDIWIWKEVGETYSWVLELADETPIKDEEIILAVASLHNQILCMTDTHWRRYDVDSGKWKKKKMKRGRRSGSLNPPIFPFTESILPCNGGVSCRSKHQK